MTKGKTIIGKKNATNGQISNKKRNIKIKFFLTFEKEILQKTEG